MLRHVEKRGPLSLSCYTLVFSLAKPLPALLSATWAAQRNTWRVIPVGGVMMEKATRREKHERMEGGGGMSRCWCTRGTKMSFSLPILLNITASKIHQNTLKVNIFTPSKDIKIKIDIKVK